MALAKPSGVSLAEQHAWRRLPEIYLVCAVFVTLLLAVLTPPFFVPDEASHSLRAMQIGHGHVLAEASPQGSGGDADRNATAAMARINSLLAAEVLRYPMARSRPDGRIAPADLAAVQALSWAHADRFVSFANTAVYPPGLYLPQAAGWVVAERLNLTIVHGLTLARLCAAFAAILAGWLALRFAVCSRTQLFLVLLLPTCLSLNASTSQDAVLFGAAALAAACLSRPLAGGRPFRTGELVLTAVLLTACIGARVPYLPLLLLLFLPSLNTAGFMRRSMVAPAVAAACAVLAIGAWQLRVRPLGTMTGPAADVARQQIFLHAHPAYAALVVARSTVFGSSFTLLKGLASLGTNDAAPPLAEYGLLVAAIVAILLLSPGGCLRTPRARLLLLTAIVGAAAAMSLAEYLIWSPPGSAQVLGLQSRYYLPLLLLLALALPARPLLRPAAGVRTAALAAGYCVFLACVLTVPLLAAHRFYNVGLLPALKDVLR